MLGLLGFVTGLSAIGIGFALGVVYQNRRAIAKVAEVRADCSKHIAESYAEGYKAAAPKRDDHGRFEPK